MMIILRHLTALSLFLISNIARAVPMERTASALSSNELIRVISGLFAVLLLIFLLSWLIKRLNVVHFSSAKGFETLASLTLGPKEKISLLKIGEHYLLIGIASNSINLLRDFGTELPIGFEPKSELKSPFATILKSAVRAS